MPIERERERESYLEEERAYRYNDRYRMEENEVARDGRYI
jgi:hypothetical protein